MRKKFDKNRKALVVALIIIAMMSVVTLSDNSMVTSAVNGMTKGLFQVSASALASADEADYDTLKSENERLKRENAQLRELLADYESVKNENRRLMKYYDLKKTNPDFTILPATVIKRDMLDDYYSFTLDCGTSSGVKVNDAVITENGLVGWVSRADMATCTVRTVLSPDTKAAAVDSKTEDNGIISGSATLCAENKTMLTMIAEDNKIKTGDMIVTSGEGGVYPKNLIIGKVLELKFNSYDVTRYAVVEPYENISEITSAAIITGFNTGESKK